MFINDKCVCFSAALWSSDFERNIDSPSQWAGVTQDSPDVFDWSFKRGSTPTWRTGPDKAASGDYYIYAEGNNRIPGDTAA